MLGVLFGLLLSLPLPLSIPADISPLTGDQSFLSGRLGGDAQLEGGCVWLDTPGPEAPGGISRHEPLWPEGYYVTFDPVRLWDPGDRLVAEEGDEVTVAGRERKDIATICQVGTPYQVERILAVDGRFVSPGG